MSCLSLSSPSAAPVARLHRTYSLPSPCSWPASIALVAMRSSILDGLQPHCCPGHGSPPPSILGGDLQGTRSMPTSSPSWRVPRPAVDQASSASTIIPPSTPTAAPRQPPPSGTRLVKRALCASNLGCGPAFPSLLPTSICRRCHVRLCVESSIHVGEERERETRGQRQGHHGLSDNDPYNY